MIYGHENILGEFIIFYQDEESKNGKILSCWSYKKELLLLIVDFYGKAHIRNITEVEFKKVDFLGNKNGKG